MVRLRKLSRTAARNRPVPQPISSKHRRPASPATQPGAERHQRLPAHGIGTAEKQHLDLMVIKPGRSLAEIAVGLEMKVAEVVLRQAAGADARPLAHLVEGIPPATGVHLRQIVEVTNGVDQERAWVIQDFARPTVQTFRDVAPITQEQPAQVGEQVVQGWRWATPSGRPGAATDHRPAEPGRNDVLGEIDADARALRKPVGCRVDHAQHMGGGRCACHHPRPEEPPDPGQDAQTGGSNVAR